jgi:hypothetical protein
MEKFAAYDWKRFQSCNFVVVVVAAVVAVAFVAFPHTILDATRRYSTLLHAYC